LEHQTLQDTPLIADTTGQFTVSIDKPHPPKKNGGMPKILSVILMGCYPLDLSWWMTRITIEITMSLMFNPPHPGLTLRDDILPALNLQVGEAAAQLGVDRTTLSKMLNGRAAISPAMALRIERWLGRDHGGAAEVWLAQQAAYDLWQARVAAKASKTLSGIKALRLQTA
jgi:addiction module HigA family antidote